MEWSNNVNHSRGLTARPEKAFKQREVREQPQYANHSASTPKKLPITPFKPFKEESSWQTVALMTDLNSQEKLAKKSDYWLFSG